MTRQSRRPGFTLIELVVVITIVALLLTIVVGGINKISHAQRRGEAMSRLQTIATALREYRQDWGDVPIYNPTHAAFNGTAAGPGLYALLECDYLTIYRMLNDPASGLDLPWVMDGGQRLPVVPGDPKSMALAYKAGTGNTILAGAGGDLTPHEQWVVYNLLADPAVHAAPTPLASDYGSFEGYDEVGNENYCSWMMQDAFTGEWKFQPVRRTVAPPTASDPFPADDATDATHYHRQLSHRWTDIDSPLYLPAGDTVVTWSSLFRQTERRAANGSSRWGQDLVLYNDGHVETLPGPSAAADERAVLRPQPR